HVLRALQALGVDDVGDDCLVFAGEVVVESLDQIVARECFRVRHSLPPRRVRTQGSGQSVTPPPVAYNPPVPIARILPVLTAFLIASPAAAQSVFTTRIDDPSAVYLSPQTFGARGDGVADDSQAVQAAIDQAAATPNGGVVFIPSGRYRVTRTIYIWRAVRVFGYGDTRPVLVLGPNTPGYQKGIGLMVMFTNAARPGPAPPPGNTRVPFPPPGQVPPRDDIPDASP